MRSKMMSLVAASVIAVGAMKPVQATTFSLNLTVYVCSFSCDNVVGGRPNVCVLYCEPA